jgi:hypothetical protein
MNRRFSISTALSVRITNGFTVGVLPSLTWLLCVCVCVHTHTHTHTYTHTRPHPHPSTHTHTHTNTHAPGRGGGGGYGADLGRIAWSFPQAPGAEDGARAGHKRKDLGRACIYTYTHTHTHSHAHAHTHTHTHTHAKGVRARAYTHTHTQVVISGECSFFLLKSKKKKTHQ